MLKFIRGWPPLIEALIVVLGAFGYPAALGIMQELGHVKVQVSETLLLSTGLYELFVLTVLCALLYVRGWDTARFGLKPERQDPLFAVGLAAVIWLLLAFLYQFGLLLHLLPVDNDAINLPLSSMSTIVLVVLYSFIDAAFEELFVCGYLLAVAKEHKHLLLGLNASLAIRVAYHLGDGAFGAITAIAFGVVGAAWYARTGRIWPVILGHAFIQLIAFAAMS